MNSPLVSVVTPVHNTVRYLEECVRSVQAQTYRHWEYVILDNASTDGSHELACRLARDDARIRVVRFDELVPQVPNYNRALRQIAPGSRYVKVVEADNWLFPDCLRSMVALAECNPAVAIVSAYNSTESRLRFVGLPLAENVVDGRRTAREHLEGKAYLFGAPTTVLMRADLVRRRQRFYREDGAPAEDLSVCYDAFTDHDFGFVHQVLTFVRTANDSILSRIKGFGAQHLDRVVMLERHGADFFSSGELARVRRVLWDRYYRTLAEGRLDGQSEAFWDFHRKGLASLGRRIDRRRLATAAMHEIASRALAKISP